ncbi:MAG: DUF418 domain-containing protein [Chloroflexota bacterium]
MTLTSTKPTQPKERIIALDFLRGFALLGILLMNIQGFSMPDAAYFNPTVYGDLTGINRWVWILSHIFADSKFMTIFSILYGAGILLVTQKLEGNWRKAAGLHYRRTFWLLIIGLMHAYLLWTGDILVLYAVTASIVFFFRKLSPTWLIVLGILTLGIGTLLPLGTQASLPFMPEETKADLIADWDPADEEITWQTAVYQSGWLTQMEDRVPSSLDMNTSGLLFWGLWRAGGLMLIGMALYKLGILTAQRSNAFYRNQLILGFGLGFPVIIYGLVRIFESNFSFEYARFAGSVFNYWGSIGVSLGYIAIIMLIAKSGRFARGIRPLAAVGRMALTNYLFHTVVATFIFYGHGLGLFGQVERIGQLLIVFGIWAAQLILSPIWLRYFKFGPAEWVWRSLTYGKLQPMKTPSQQVKIVA